MGCLRKLLQPGEALKELQLGGCRNEPRLTILAEAGYNVYSDYGDERMSKTHVISSRLEPDQGKRLARKAKQLGRTPSETGALLIEEGLRRDEFAFLDFRDSPVGRQSYVQGSTLAV